MFYQRFLLQVPGGFGVGVVHGVEVLFAQQSQRRCVVALCIGQPAGLLAHSGAANVCTGLLVGLLFGHFNDGGVVRIGFIVLFQRSIRLCTADVSLDVVRVQPDSLGKGRDGFGVIGLGEVFPAKLHLLVKAGGTACTGRQEHCSRKGRRCAPHAQLLGRFPHDDSSCVFCIKTVFLSRL